MLSEILHYLLLVLVSGFIRSQAKGSLLANSSSVQKANLSYVIPKLDNIWSMVASMGGNDGSSRTEYENSAKNMKFDWDIKLDKLGRYRLNWRVSYPSNHITFALDLKTKDTDFRIGTDIFALGFSETGELSSSDYCIMWYDLSHQIHLQDAKTDAKNRLELIDTSESVCKLLRDTDQSSSTDDNSDDDKRETIDNDEDGQNDSKGQQYQIGSSEDDHRSHDQPEKVEVVFKRPLDVCDAKMGRTYYTIDEGTTNLVWFTLRGPVLSIDGLNITDLIVSSSQHFHSNTRHRDTRESSGNKNFEFGLKRVQLIATKSRPIKNVTNKSHRSSLDIRMDKYHIPAKETTYWCKLFKLPNKFESRRYHITSYEAVIEDGNEHIVHHMELFNCADLSRDQENDIERLYTSEGGWSGECSSKDRPIVTDSCRRVILAWAMGARPLVYPEQVGQSIGGHDYSPYVVLEVHYNNVDSTSGLVDSSGLRFHYVSKLRPFDAGVLEVGLEYTDKNSIPPKMVTPIAGHCVSECTRVAMSSAASSSGSSGDNEDDHYWASLHERDRKHRPNAKEGNLKEGIYIFAAQMHTHLAGVASWTEHVREGRLLGELQRDNHYSPHFQEIRLLPRPVHVAPGDALIHYCLYDTTKRKNITLGGYATSDEMCVTYLHYYPKIDLEVCKSSIETKALERYFAYLAREEQQKTSKNLLELHLGPTENASAIRANELKSVSENYHLIEWSPRRSRELLQLYANAPLAVQCNRSNGQRWPGHWNGIAPTRLWRDYTNSGDQGDPPGELGDNQAYGTLPYELRPLNGQQLVDYRGHGLRRRHARCDLAK